MTFLKVAAAQFAGTEHWEENLETCIGYARRCIADGTDLLVLPEAADRTRKDGADDSHVPQPLTGPFISGLAAVTAGTDLTVVAGTVEETGEERPSNTLVAVSGGRIAAVYRKIHLYDAFAHKESDRFLPGDGPLETFDVKGFSVGMMTCYDIRFPEVARALAVQGADIFALPTSWVAGPLKEMHWDIMTRARALENTCYLVTSSKTGPARIGMSSVVDPLGVIRAQLGHEEGMLSTVISMDQLDAVRAKLPVLQQRRLRTDLEPMPFDSTSTTGE